MLPEPGDRIRLDYMPKDPDPIPPGTKGTVRKVVPLSGNEAQIMVDWDIRRSLSLVYGVDEFTIIEKHKETDK